MTIRLSDGQEMKSRLNSESSLDNYLESYSIPFLNVGNVGMNDFKKAIIVTD